MKRWIALLGMTTIALTAFRWPEQGSIPTVGISPSATSVAIGDELTIVVTSTGMGLPEYTLTVTNDTNSTDTVSIATTEEVSAGTEATALFEVVSVVRDYDSGREGSATFVLRARAAGSATARANVNGEVEQEEGIFTFENVSSNSLSLTVTTSTETGGQEEEQPQQPETGQPETTQPQTTQPAQPQASQPQAPSGPTFNYTVKRGDTLFGIARSAGVSVDDIIRLNSGVYPTLTVNPGRLVVGWDLQIPANVSVTASPGGTYTVQRGDNLFRIGLAYNMDWRLIAQANGIGAPNALRVGQVLTIPGAANTTYTVQRGDYLRSIARRFGVDWQALATANGIFAPYVVYPGQTLVVPS